MDKDGLKKELEYLIMAKNHIWASILGTFGGTFSVLFININYMLKAFLFISGLILTLIFLENYFRKDAKIEKIIELLKYGGKQQ